MCPKPNPCPACSALADGDYCSDRCRRHHRYGGICRVCGVSTSGASSKEPPDLCRPCAARERRVDPAVRFWRKVKKGDICWTWQGTLSVPGRYGKFGVGAGKTVYAHRFSYEFYIGPIPEGQQIDHLCRNRVCVNPDHLEAVPQRENLLRGIGFSAVNARKRFCPAGHSLEGDNLTGMGKRVGRNCKTCARERARGAARGSPPSSATSSALAPVEERKAA